jgi:hypothetical protein
MSKTIIKGAIYTDGDELLRPHYSGDFHTVDCTEYKTAKEIRENYSEESFKKFVNEDAFYLTYNEEKYYQCEYSPFHTENFELLSDISELEFYDNETSF